MMVMHSFLWRLVKPSPANPQEDSLFTLRMLPVPLSVPSSQKEESLAPDFTDVL